MAGLGIDAVLTALFVALTMWAIWRRPDAVPFALLIGLGMATFMAQLVGYYDLPGVLALLDGAVAIAMVALLTHCMERNACVWCDRARRAQAVCVIAALKAGAGLLFVSGQMASAPVELPWTPYAWAINISFVAQVAIAGGWLDGVAILLSRLFGRLGGQRFGAAHHRGRH